MRCTRRQDLPRICNTSHKHWSTRLSWTLAFCAVNSGGTVLNQYLARVAAQNVNKSHAICTSEFAQTRGPAVLPFGSTALQRTAGGRLEHQGRLKLVWRPSNVGSPLHTTALGWFSRPLTVKTSATGDFKPPAFQIFDLPWCTWMPGHGPILANPFLANIGVWCFGHFGPKRFLANPFLTNLCCVCVCCVGVVVLWS